ncbi:MAG TPA: nucleotide exchange factor GrpE [Acidimicrobiales bacterium]|nr:nucleotide exchange factor GrpE [Acidimicrobiales bacterium]
MSSRPDDDAPVPEGGPTEVPDAVAQAASAAGVGGDDAPADLEALATETLDRLEAVTVERDDYLDRLQRLHADFDTYRKRAAKEATAAGDRASAALAEKLLPVLDSCDAALRHGAEGVEPVFTALLGTLEKEGLERLDPLDAPFDPNVHEAVLHEHGDGGESTVVEVLRPGYAWKGQVIRAAMVKVKG